MDKKKSLIPKKKHKVLTKKIVKKHEKPKHEEAEVNEEGE